MLGFEDAVPGLMSFTNTVPAEVPSLVHSSKPLCAPDAPLLAAKYTLVPIATSPVGAPLPEPWMSLTSTVPALVPSLFHSSVPLGWLVAEKCRVEPTTARLAGLLLLLPGLMSLTNTVPAVVPSLFHSSVSSLSSVATKYRVVPTAVKLVGFEDGVPGLMSLTNTVPAAVPLLFQSSGPLPPPSAWKKRLPPTTVSGAATAEKLFSTVVPAAVPSVFHKPRVPGSDERK